MGISEAGREKIRKLLCWLELHDWIYVHLGTHFRACADCHTQQGLDEGRGRWLYLPE